MREQKWCEYPHCHRTSSGAGFISVNQDSIGIQKFYCNEHFKMIFEKEILDKN